MVALSHPRAIALYVVLVTVWSSTWLAIKIGLEDCPPLLGSGVRFAAAGLLLLAITVVRRGELGTDFRLATVLALFPFALTFGLIYWGEQYLSSGLTAVLFGTVALYTALLGALVLPDAALSWRLIVGILVAIGGVALAFVASARSGDPELAVVGGAAVAVAPLGTALGTVALKLRGRAVDAIALNGWAMLGGGVILLAASALTERWSDLAWTPQSIGSIAYLAIVGSALGYVIMTVMLRDVSALVTSYIHLLVPFGAVALGAALYGEDVGLRVLAGAALVSTGLLVAQPGRATATRAG